MKVYFKYFLLIAIIISFQTIYSKNKGLFNCGNSCYFNASLQCLSHLDKFNNLLEEKLYAQDDLIPRFYISLMKQIKGDGVISCSEPILNGKAEQDFYNLAGPLLPRKKLNNQEDASEFINFMLNKLIDPYFGKNNLFPKAKTTALINLFNLESISELKTSCGHKSEKPEKTLNIELSVPDKVNEIPLLDRLNAFSIEDQLSDVYCDQCNKTGDATKSLTIGKLPEYFVISLKRFDYDYVKNHPIKFSTPVIFPLKLEIMANDPKSKFINSALKKTLGSSVISYNLLVFIVHGGSTANSGHYWAYGKDKGGDWYLYNDSTVSKQELKSDNGLKDVLTTGIDMHNGWNPATPYILFYELDAASRLILKLTQLKSSLQELKTKVQALREKLTALQGKLKS
jgi:ubiquitin carboxyl-terminal hydrolase 36/42